MRAASGENRFCALVQTVQNSMVEYDKVKRGEAVSAFPRFCKQENSLHRADKQGNKHPPGFRI